MLRYVETLVGGVIRFVFFSAWTYRGIMPRNHRHTTGSIRVLFSLFELKVDQNSEYIGSDKRRTFL